MQISSLEEFDTYGFIHRQVHACAIDMSAGGGGGGGSGGYFGRLAYHKLSLC